MVEKQTIIHMYSTRGCSKRAIAREQSISRKTVHRVIAEYESSLKLSDPEASLETILTTTPRYDSSNCRHRVITGTVKELIGDCLEKNTRKRVMGLKKQCMCGKYIYELLFEKDFEIRYPSVCKYIASLAKQKEENKSQEAFSINMHFENMEDAQKHLLTTCERINTRSASAFTVDKVESLAAPGSINAL